MTKRLAFASALAALAVLAGAQGASASPKCRPTGFPCPTWATSGTFNGSFRDEFNDTVVGPAWEKGWFGEGITNHVNSLEDDCYDSANVSESGGSLRLRLTDVPATCNGVTQPYRGSLVNTRNSFLQRFGSFEASVCMPDGNADGLIDNWPGWWTAGTDTLPWPDLGEIDIAEGGSGYAEFHAHYRDTSGVEQHVNYTPPTPLAGCHRFGVRWASTGTVTVYRDGVQVLSHAFNGPVVEYLIFDHAVDAQGGAVVVPNNDLTVDWVRAWV